MDKKGKNRKLRKGENEEELEGRKEERRRIICDGLAGATEWFWTKIEISKQVMLMK